MTLVGMDTVTAQHACAELTAGAQQIVQVATRLEGALTGFEWNGSDAERTRDTWSGSHRPHLQAASQAVSEMARLILAQSQQQDTASAATTGAAVGAAGAALGATAANGSDVQRLVDSAAAHGLSGPALDRYREHLAQMTPEQRAKLDPSTFRGDQAKQPDETTCGSSSLVMARMINNPAYAMRVIDGYDPTTGETVGGTAKDRFGAEAVAMHHRTNGLFDRDGDLQSPWPERWGTGPGPLAQEMSSAGGSGVPGTDYEVDYVRLGDRDGSFDALASASRAGHAVPVYVGSEWAPRHVVLLTGATDDSLTFYEPGDGVTKTVSRAAWESDSSALGGWNKPWAIVVPRH